MTGKLLFGSAALALTMSLATAGPPVDNISSQKHPNPAAAPRACYAFFGGGYAFSRLDAPSALGLYCDSPTHCGRGRLQRAPPV